MNVIYAFYPVLFVFFTLGAFSWTFAGTDTPSLLPVIVWTWIFTLEVLLFLPERHKGESGYAARKRTWEGLSRDPLTYIVLGCCVVLVIPFCNQGLCKVCDYPKIMAGLDPEPLCKYLPFCVNPREHISVVLWAVPSFTAMLAAKHALTARGKRVLLEMAIWNATLLAALGFVQQAMDAPGPLWCAMSAGGNSARMGSFFSTFGYPNMAGCFFTMAYAASIGLWYHKWSATLERHVNVKDEETGTGSLMRRRYWWVGAYYLIIPTVVLFFAALATLSRAAILLSYVVTGFWFLYIFLASFTRRGRGTNLATRVKATAMTLLAIGAFVLAAVIFAPPEYKKEVASLNVYSIFTRGVGDGGYHARVSMAMFRDYPFFGVGGWGYRHFCQEYMEPEEARHIQTIGGANVHNDWMQLMAEHGAVGAILFSAVLVVLLLPFFMSGHHALVRNNFEKSEESRLPRPKVLFSIPAPATGAILALVAGSVHAFADCPFRSPAVLCELLLFLTAATGFLPEEEAR